MRLAESYLASLLERWKHTRAVVMRANVLGAVLSPDDHAALLTARLAA
jgi:hypothetical protein